MQKYIGLLLLVFMCSCKSKIATIPEGSASKALSADKIIENHYKNIKGFSTIYIKSNVSYKDDKKAQKLTAEIKIKKDEIILVSIRFLGITMAKALITPQEVKYYEKLNGKYFEGNYSTLSKWLGMDLDFEKVQNMLTGQALYNLKTGKYKTTVEDKLYTLEDKSESNIQKEFFFEADNFLIKEQKIVQVSKGRALKITYPTYKKFDTFILPMNLDIEASQQKRKTNISIDYNTVIINEELSFPYSVPEAYERIFID